jgi:enamine deaminase RidA (YjgF/YER057c/UK114 family)
LGDLSKTRLWTRAFGVVNASLSFKDHPIIINGFTNLIIEIFGENVGSHARSAVGMSSLPFNVCVEIEAELIIH